MSTVIVIFGATGDLTARKLIPALYNNFCKKRLPDQFSVIGFARKQWTSENFREVMKESLKKFVPAGYDEKEWNAFASRLFYHQGEFEGTDHYQSLARCIEETSGSSCNALFYLATAPEYYSMIASHLAEVKLLAESEQGGHRRIVVEKPFGRDLPSALALNQVLHGFLKENQIYRIDHYLGKETVQNMIVFRFGNAIFEPLWNRNYIDHIQITVAEEVGVEHRAGYYDTAGVLRDVFQNHLFQLLTLITMEPPVEFEAEALRNEKVKVLSAVREISPEHSALATVRGQYEGYRKEPGVAADSQTETFAAMKLFIDNWRWQGVPFYLRSGKAMKEKASEITVQFRRPPTQILDKHSGKTELFTNRLTMCIQPDEGIHLRFIAKVPDQGMETRPVEMDFDFQSSFGVKSIPEAYERLLLDALNGDASLFARSDEISLAWTLVDGIRQGWDGDHAPPLVSYKPGSWGPGAADELLGRDGRWWIHNSKLHLGQHPDPDTE